MLKTISIVQLVLAVVLIASILMQHRGTGLGGVFGSQGNVYRSKRGMEKVLFNSTIVIGVLFVLLSLAYVILSARLGN